MCSTDWCKTIFEWKEQDIQERGKEKQAGEAQSRASYHMYRIQLDCLQGRSLQSTAALVACRGCGTTIENKKSLDAWTASQKMHNFAIKRTMCYLSVQENGMALSVGELQLLLGNHHNLWGRLVDMSGCNRPGGAAGWDTRGTALHVGPVGVIRLLGKLDRFRKQATQDQTFLRKTHFLLLL